MGEGKKQALRVSFDGHLKLEFHGSTITSDAGLLVYRELDEVLELTARSGGLLDEWRTGKNTQHSLVALCASRSSAVWRATTTPMMPNVAVDPTIRYVVGGRAANALPPPPARWAASRRKC